MGPEQLAGVMETVERTSAASQGKALDEEALRAKTAGFRDEVQRDGEAYATSAVLHDDGIIDPRDTREVLGTCLEVVKVPGVRGAEAHGVLARM